GDAFPISDLFSDFVSEQINIQSWRVSARQQKQVTLFDQLFPEFGGYERLVFSEQSCTLITLRLHELGSKILNRLARLRTYFERQNNDEDHSTKTKQKRFGAFSVGLLSLQH